MMPLLVHLEMRPCLNLDTHDHRAEVPRSTPLPWDALPLPWGRTRSPGARGRAGCERPLLRPHSKAAAPKHRQPGFAGGRRLRDEPQMLHVLREAASGVLGAGCRGRVSPWSSRALRGGSRVPGLAHGESAGETSQVMNCSAEHLGGCQSPPGKPPGAPDWPGAFPMVRGEDAAGEEPSPASQSTVKHLIVPVPTISLAWIYALRGHLW